MEDCIFCKIVRGEIPFDKIYEDSNFLAFLDIQPRNPGHTLVIPKEHYRWVWDVPKIDEYFETVRKIIKPLQKTMKTEYVVSFVAGDDVHHAHVHLVPRTENDGHGGFLNTKIIRKLSKEEMKEIASKIRSNF